MRKLFPLIMLSVLVVGCAGSVVRPQVEAAIRRSLPDYIGPAKNYTVHASASMSDMLDGRLDGLRIEGEDVKVDPNLTIAWLFIDLHDVRVNTQTFELKSVGSTAIRATVSEDAVNRYIEETRGSSDLSVNLQAGKIQVHYAPSVAGVHVPMTVAGKLVIVSRDKVNFVADKASLGLLPVSTYVVNKGLQLVNPVIDLSTMRFPVTIEGIEIRKGAADVRGSAKFGPKAQ